MAEPRVSIGLPVYNGELQLESALNSILGQTYTDFELVISDNASTDRTQEICLAFAARDPRIRYYRNDHNLGLTPNFNRAFELTKGEYFGFASHDDYRAPTFIERCLEVLDRDPTVVLCMSQIMLVDDEGRNVAQYDSRLQFPHEMDPEPHWRFHDLIMVPHLCVDDYGLMRSAALRKIKPLYASHDGNDRNMLAELSLYGKFAHVPETLYYWRDQRWRDLDFALWSARLDTAKADQIPFPRWQTLHGYYATLRRVELAPKQRLLCYGHLAEWAVRHTRGLAKDAVRGGDAWFHRHFRSSHGAKAGALGKAD
ncbi:MAG: glycosyltransferase [Anaerolineales bacterium]|nr:glycosyltransferase [Anaerolineales bacterium]